MAQLFLCLLGCRSPEAPVGDFNKHIRTVFSEKKDHWPNISLTFLEHPAANAQALSEYTKYIRWCHQNLVRRGKEPNRKESNFILTFNRLNIRIYNPEAVYSHCRYSVHLGKKNVLPLKSTTSLVCCC